MLVYAITVATLGLSIKKQDFIGPRKQFLERLPAQHYKLKLTISVSLLLVFLAILFAFVSISMNAPELKFASRSFEAEFGKNRIINLFMFYSIPLSYFVILFYSERSQFFSLAFISVTVIALISWGIKGNIFMLFLIMLFLLDDLNKLNKKWLYFSFAFIPIIFISMMLLRYGLPFNFGTIWNMWPKMLGYVSYNFSNLQSYVNAKDTFAVGLGLLFAIPCLFVTGTHWCLDTEFGVDRSKPYELYADPSFNIETGLGKIYVEFGYLVFVLFPLLMGVVHVWVYRSRYKSILSHGVYIVIMMASTLHFFDFRLIHPVTIFTLIVVTFLPSIKVSVGKRPSNTFGKHNSTGITK